MRIVAALGNPGEKYRDTRHNIAWLALDHRLGPVRWREEKRFEALCYEAGGVLYLKPLTFMNESGRSIHKALSYYKLIPKTWSLWPKKDADLNGILTVIHDDLDIDFGAWRQATDSGSAGNRGVQSIIDYLKTKKFGRLRLGIKTPLLRQPIPPEKFVLQSFSREEKERLEGIFSSLPAAELT